MNDSKTKDWRLYEAGKQYNNRLTPNYYDTVNANIAFYNGDQWRGLTDSNLPKPVFNIIKRVISYFVASLTSSNVKIHFEPMLYSDIDQSKQMQLEVKAAEYANEKVDQLFDKFKMEFKAKEALFDAAITGDGAAHFYFDMDRRPYGEAYSNIKGEIEMELVDGANVFFGNANSPKVQSQPYIIISGRDMVKSLQEEAQKHAKNNPDNPNDIEADYDYMYQAGDASRIEVNADGHGKALYIIVYRRDKQTGRIFASKSVENAYIYKDVDTGLNQYPVAWMNWEKQKNQYHGRALCTGMLPNQIFINRMFAMVMYHLMMTAFPKAVYNKQLINSWTNEIGAAIPIDGADPSLNIKNIAGYLEPSQMSNQITGAIEMAMQLTKDTLGVNDALLGDFKPTNTSAIIALQKSASVPLENPKANMYEWIEDIGRILFDMMGTYYGTRPIVVEKDGQKIVEDFNFDVFKEMWMDVKADVGEASYWSEISSIQTLDNLLSQGKIDLVNYLKRIPDEYIPQKQELIDELEHQSQQPDPQAILSHLSPQEQQAFQSAPPPVQQQMLQQAMQAAQGQQVPQPQPQG